MVCWYYVCSVLVCVLCGVLVCVLVCGVLMGSVCSLASCIVVKYRCVLICVMVCECVVRLHVYMSGYGVKVFVYVKVIVLQV